MNRRLIVAFIKTLTFNFVYAKLPSRIRNVLYPFLMACERDDNGRHNGDEIN